MVNIIRSSPFRGLCFLPILLLCIVCRPTVAAADVTIYVSPDGNDAWTGKAAAPDGKDGGPLATPGRAIAMVRALKAAPGAPQGGYTVLLRGGTYYLTSPLIFGPADSGTSDAPNTYRAFPNEQPIVSGGARLTGWKIDDKGRWHTQLPDVANGSWRFSQLYADDQRRSTARLPKTGYYRTTQELPGSGATQGKGYDRFGYAKGDIDPQWHDFPAVQIKLLLNWSSATFHVADMDAQERVVRVNGKTRANWYKLAIGTRYRVENVKEALSEPGEFYLDRSTGELTYVPVAGEAPDRTTIVAPRLEHLVAMSDRGGEAQGVSNLRFEGITFAHSNWTVPESGVALGQSAIGLPAAIAAVGARNVEFEGITVRNTGAHGLVLGPGSQFDRVANGRFYDLGAGGILVGDAVSSATYANLFKRSGDSDVSDMSIDHNVVAAGGRVEPAGSGIWIGNSPRNKVTNNDISDLFYSAISVGWVWGYGESKARDNLISGNRIKNIGQNVLSDLAGIYTLGVSPGTVITGNTISNVVGYLYGGFGFNLDEGSSDILVEKNLVYATSDGGLSINFGRNLVVQNNVFALGRNAQLTIGKAERELTLTFERNVVYWNSAHFLLSGPWVAANVVFDNNIYWNALASGISIVEENVSLDRWKSLGRDKGSLVANPSFRYLTDRGFEFSAKSRAVEIGLSSFNENSTKRY